MAGPFHVNMPDLIAKLNELWEMAEEGGGGGGGTEIAVEQDGEDVADADTLNILGPLTAATDGAGRVKIGIAMPEGGNEFSLFVVNNVVNQFTKAQYIAPVAVTCAPTVNINHDLSNLFTLQVDQHFELGTPYNAGNGVTGMMLITQDLASPKSIAFSADWFFPNGESPNLTQQEGARDLLSWVRFGSLYIATMSPFHGYTDP